MFVSCRSCEVKSVWNQKQVRNPPSGPVRCQTFNITTSQKTTSVFDLLSQTYGGDKAMAHSPPVSKSPRPPKAPRGPPRPPGCQFLELCHYKDSRTASLMLKQVPVQTCKQQKPPTERTDSAKLQEYHHHHHHHRQHQSGTNIHNFTTLTGLGLGGGDNLTTSVFTLQVFLLESKTEKNPDFFFFLGLDVHMVQCFRYILCLTAE